MRMVFGIATRCWPEWTACVFSWQNHAILGHYPRSVVINYDVMPAYQKIYETTDEDIIALLHDDLVIYEYSWDVRVLRAFSDPTVGLVCFGGAAGHGAPNLYTVPYHLPNLARQNFMSNMRGGEKHGAIFKGERDVAVADGFALFVRRVILDNWHHIRSITQVVGGGKVVSATDIPAHTGWPVGEPYGYFMYSEALCCEARRQGYRIRLVGVDCEHLGGKSSGFISPKENYEEAHRYFYEHNRDVMPYRVPE